MATYLGNQDYAWWRGADGNIWANIGGVGVKNLGAGFGGGDSGPIIMSYADPMMPSDRLDPSKKIADPNAPAPVQSAPSGGGGGGSSGPNKVLNQAAVDNTMKAIGTLDSELSGDYRNIDADYNKLIGGYNRERTRTKGEYDDGKVTNNQNLQQNKQNALVSGAQGLRGLRGVLGSIGALSGDGGKLANQAVTTEVNRDIGGAAETAAGNSVQLDKAWDRFDEEDDERRIEAKDNRTNSRIAAKGAIASKRQDYYQKLAELYGEVDNTGAAKSWLDKAGDLNSAIVAGKRRVASPFKRMGAAFTPGEFESYLAGAGDMTVEVRNGGTEGGELNPDGLLGGTGIKDEEEKRRRFAVV